MNANEADQEEVSHKKIENILNAYCEGVKQGLDSRWKSFNIDLSKIEFFEIVGGLLARQASLTINVAKTPCIWNPHIIPLIYRAQIDAYITLAWILEYDSHERSKKYILYGLGQEKLQIAHLESSINEEMGKDELEMTRTCVELRKSWLNEQLFDFLTEVDLGSWSGLSVREMAEQANCLDLYNYAYSPFSMSVHSTWGHIARYDLKKCKNPLHKKHRIPYVKDFLDLDFESLMTSAKYVQKAFSLVDEKLKLNCEIPLPQDHLFKLLSDGLQ